MTTIERDAVDDTQQPPVWWKSTRAQWGIVCAAFGLIGVLVSYPVARGGWLLLLDWNLGPHVSLPRAFWGLDHGLMAGMPFALLTLASHHLLGGQLTSWLPLAIVSPLAGLAMARLVRGTLFERLAAGLFYSVNPLIFERSFAGQFGFLLGYALLPLAAASFLDNRSSGWRAALRNGLWIAVLTGLSVHFAWIASLLLLATEIRRRYPARALGRVALTGAAAGVMSAYLAVGPSGQTASVGVGVQDLASFRTVGDPHFGLGVNVAGLYGFWRQQPRLPKDAAVGWPILLLAIVLVAAVGARAALRNPARRAAARGLLLAGAAAYLFALGDQGPTGEVYEWLFLHVPGFTVMREPQKFVCLLALAYSCFFGWGVQELIHWAANARIRRGTAAACLVLPLVYTPTMFFGLAGQLQTSRYPNSWKSADRIIGPGPGKVLFLPWHQYLSFPFTGRIIANPADNALRAETIVGDNVELRRLRTASRSVRSAYLEFLFANGPRLCRFGHLVAPLAIQYIAVAKTLDYGTYQWLSDQDDLRQVLERPDLLLYENLAWRGLTYRTDALERFPNWTALVTAANRGDAVRSPIVATMTGSAIPDSDCPSGEPEGATTLSGGAGSPVARPVPLGSTGYIVLGDPFDRSWRLGEGHAIQLAGGTMAFRSTGQAPVARNAHWRSVRLAYAVSILGVLVACVAPARRRRLFDRPSTR